MIYVKILSIEILGKMTSRSLRKKRLEVLMMYQPNQQANGDGSKSGLESLSGFMSQHMLPASMDQSMQISHPTIIVFPVKMRPSARRFGKMKQTGELQNCKLIVIKGRATKIQTWMAKYFRNLLLGQYIVQKFFSLLPQKGALITTCRIK